MGEVVSHNSAIDVLKNLRDRLLDLTGRNRLINFRHTKSSCLRVIDELPNQLVETLLADKEMRFIPVSEPTLQELVDAGYIEIDDVTGEEHRLKKDPSAEEWAKHLNLETSFDVPVPENSHEVSKHTDMAIQTLLFPYELEARLRRLHQTSRTAIEETGANMLYLVFGFLEWFDSPNSTNSRLAPLFLVPVRLQKGKLNAVLGTYEYSLSYSDEDIIPNLSLREKLRIDFSLALPELDENTQPETYFEEVESVICKSHPRWKLRRYITLSLLNFSKLLMYLDLDPIRWPKEQGITSHPIISRFLTGYGVDELPENKNIDLGFGEEHSIDELPEIHTKYPLIYDADSSQHSALIDVVEGENLVIEGPPGTGKSQTITNLIGAALIQGKKVLFVAEKLAALNIVKRRLDSAGLGEFCLELHSHKTQKRKLLNDVSERINKKGHYRKPAEIAADISRFEDLKNSLKTHVQRINQTWKETGKTKHEIFMAATRYRELLKINPEYLHPDGYSGENFDADMQRRARDQVIAFSDAFKTVEERLGNGISLSQHPWYGVRNIDLQVFDIDKVIIALEDWQSSLIQLKNLEIELIETLNCEPSSGPKTITDYEEIALELEQLPDLKGNELLDTLHLLKGERLSKVKKYIKQFESIQTLYRILSKRVSTEAIENLSLVGKYLKGGSSLVQFIDGTVKLGEIDQATQRLTRVHDQLVQLQDFVSELQTKIGKSAVDFLNLSESGLHEIKTFIELVSSLPPSEWKNRNELFDNDELDDALPKIRKEIENLHQQQEKLSKVYDVKRIPDKDTQKEYQQIVSSSGILRWFKPTWRKTRKQIISQSANTDVKFKDLIAALNDSVTYSDQLHKLKNNSTYKSLLGDHSRGLDTDIGSLETVREWYRQVRQTYGVGFGPKIALGDAAIGLPPDLSKAIRSLSEQGICKKLDDILSELKQLKVLFAPVTALQDSKTLLVGDGDLLVKLKNKISVAIKECKSLITDENISLTEFMNQITALDSLHRTVSRWEKADYDNRFFRGRLGLQIGANTNNNTALSISKNTLDIANCITNKIKKQIIVDRIYEKPEPSTINSLRKQGKKIKDILKTLNLTNSKFEELVLLDKNKWLSTCGIDVAMLIERNSIALEQRVTLQDWLDYVRIRQQLNPIGLNKLAETIEKGEISASMAEVAFYAGIFDLLAREILRAEPELGRFSGRAQESLQRQFKEYDDRLKKLQSENIAWEADKAHVPQGSFGGRVSDYTEFALLEHECGKQKRHIPIRQLLRRAGTALSALKPCFMMGPMSVAQYLAPGQIEFDLIVMDEASQIKPEDALGAIARGKQLVVVGDPKQLPPTSFFDRVIEDDDEDPSAIEESESILDATRPMFSARRLRWHYRSKHESLIAFSNHYFYDSNLILFPSPHKDLERLGISFTRVRRGCFVNRRNLEEAKVIANKVREHFSKGSDETIGVVAMNVEQRDQIESAIESLAKDDISFQEWLEKDQTNQESLFVKNLENVQGDERDVIIISMTYGPQEPRGKVFQRFGPINSNVGWRRLNVLFTRSRRRMLVISSMGSDDIVVDTSSKLGVKALRDFLAFCETGILQKGSEKSGRDPDSDFEIAVADALRDEGFECVPQVGVAGFFIDIAIVDPGNPGRYLMGIECDGATYHSAKSVRDRDRIRQDILEQLGWRIRRIWSTDWFRNPRAEIQPIIRELHELKTDLPVVSEIPAESVEEETIDEIEIWQEESNEFVTESVQLKDKLIEFDQKVIRKTLPDTPENKRLLRPAMLEALLEYRPINKSEFLEYIPPYLRLAISPQEGQFLEKILELINSEFELSAEQV